MNNRSSPQRMKPTLREHARIVRALFAKDTLEALKNKNIVVVLLTSVLMVFFYSGLPALSSQDEPPSLLVHDAGSSRLVALLENSRDFQLTTYPNEGRMKQALADGTAPELGLVIPDSFDQALQAGETPVLEGYVVRWVQEQNANTLRQTAESEIAALLGRQVQVRLGERVDLLPDSGGLGETAAFGLAFVVIMIGVILIPHLMLEEKQNRTLEVLAVSPASAGHIVAGKALAGLFYCSLGGLVALAVNRALVVHWWLALLAVLLGSLFTVSLGLWLGIKIDSRAQLAMWSWAILLPLIMPIIFSSLQGLIPDVWGRIFSLIPSSVVFQLARTSFANPIPVGKTILQLAWVAAAAGAVLVAVAWIMRRQDRGAGVFASTGKPAIISEIGDESQGFFAALLERLASLLRPQTAGGPQPSLAGRDISPEPRPRSSLAMIRAIAAKDLVEALKNRLILSILLGSTFILLSGAALPALLSSKNLPRLVVYDQGRSTTLRALADREDLRLSLVDTRAVMEAALASFPDLALGLALPADFDPRAASGQTIQLQAYYPHWANPEDLSERAAFFEARLSQASGAPVRLDLAGGAVYPALELTGRTSMLLLNLVTVILVIGVALVPLLLVEEKESQTLRALLVSPASLGQVLAGKGLVGLFFSLLPALVIMLFYHSLFIHWEIAILAVLLTAAVAVAAGLLLGLLADSPTTLSMWGALLLVLLLGSALLKLFSGLSLPPAVQSALDWLPGAAMLQLFSLSQVGQVPAGMLWLNAGALLAAIAVIAVLLAWRSRQMEG